MLVSHEPTRVAFADLNFAAYNPRKPLTEAQRAELEASLREFGLVLNLVVQKQSDGGEPMVLIGGHKRVEVARSICLKEGWPEPVDGWAVVVDVDDRTAKRMNVALNKIDADWDLGKLANLMLDIGDQDDGELLATGFTSAELETLIADNIELPPGDDPFGQFGDAPIDDGFVNFKFGDFGGRVSRKVYKSFLTQLEARRAADGEGADVMLDDILRRWLDV